MDQTSPNTPKPNGGGVANGSTHSYSAENAEARERLMQDLKHAIQDAEQWLRGAASAGSDDLTMVKAKFEDTLRTAKRDLHRLEDSMMARGKIAAEATNVYVHDNPWKSVALGAAVGIALGVLITRNN
ncbi:YqjD family protein [Pseudoduganella sp. UC29_106]|uniref:DUF883 family protein n=1 Tax=Pseudoduganella sp. UC29_106 TaxID=3374553 RepID=UPI00375638DA